MSKDDTVDTGVSGGDEMCRWSGPDRTVVSTLVRDEGGGAGTRRETHLYLRDYTGDRGGSRPRQWTV